MNRQYSIFPCPMQKRYYRVQKHILCPALQSDPSVKSALAYAHISSLLWLYLHDDMACCCLFSSLRKALQLIHFCCFVKDVQVISLALTTNSTGLEQAGTRG